MDVQLFQHRLLKRFSLLHCIAFVPYLRSVDCVCFWALYSIPLTYLSISSAVPTAEQFLLNSTVFTVSLEVLLLYSLTFYWLF